MTLPIPRCAYCGRLLDMRRRDDERGGRIIHQYTAIPGAPQVAWCGGMGDGPRCHTDDPLAAELMEARDRNDVPGRRATTDVLLEIDARGPGRLVAGAASRRWHRDHH